MNISGKMKKRGQEEIVGFVVIMLIVAIIFLIILGFAINRAGQGAEKRSLEVEHFLGSMMEYTTDCAIGYVPNYARVGKLINECRAGKQCYDGRESCIVLNETVSGIIKNGLRVGANKPILGYEFDAGYVRNISNAISKENIARLKEGDCESDNGVDIIGADTSRSSPPGSILISLKTCF